MHVLTRGERARQLAGPALAALDRGGTLAVAGIYLSDIPSLNYQKHLFQERQLRSVTSNTRADAREFLGIAAEHHLAVTVHPYPLDAAGPVRRPGPPAWSAGPSQADQGANRGPHGCDRPP